MAANWYVDPLGRFDGRYWDGSQWTAQVKQGNRLVIDPDWPPTVSAPDIDVTTSAEPDRGVKASVESASVSAVAAADVTASRDVPRIEIPTTPGTRVGIDRDPAATMSRHAVGQIDVRAPEMQVPEMEAADRVGVATPSGAVTRGVVTTGEVTTGDAPAVQAVVVESRRGPDIAGSSVPMTESPARTVARLDTEGTMGATVDVGQQVTPPMTSDVATENPGPSGRLWPWILAAAVLLAGLLVFLLPRLSSNNDDVADADRIELADADADAVAEADAAADADAVADAAAQADGGADADADAAADAVADAAAAVDTAADTADVDTGGTTSDDDPAAADDAASTGVATKSAGGDDGLIEAGDLSFMNGIETLSLLEEWHIDALTVRGLDLQTQCWFAESDGAAVQAAHCGPTGSSDEGVPTFDLIPLHFDQGGDAEVRVTPLLDAVTEDVQLPDDLQLIGIDGRTTPAEIGTGPATKSG